MQKVGVWEISNGEPHKIQESSVISEQDLEEWIESDPDLLQVGLTIVGRQIDVEGGRLDLLALDPQGRWVVIEIKRGMLRRETVAQVLDYASCLATLPVEELQQKVDAYLRPRNRSLQTLLGERDAQDALALETREILLFVVGAGKAFGLDRMVSFLSDRYRMPISLVSFDVFTLMDGQQILARELTEPDTTGTTPTRTSQERTSTVEQLCILADQNSIGHSFRAILEVAEQYGLYARTYKSSIMYTSPANRSRMLFTVWSKPTAHKMKLYVSPKAFAEFYPVSQEEATVIFGEDGWREIDDSQIEQFLNSLRMFFRKAEEQTL